MARRRRGDTTPEGGDPPVLLALPEVRRLVGLGRSTLLRYVAAGRFPAPLVLGAAPGVPTGRGRVHRWRRDEVLAWIERQPRSTDLGTAQ